MARTFALELALNLKAFRDGMREVATGLANGVKAGASGFASSLKPAADGVREIGAAAKEAQVAMLALSGAAAMGLRTMIKNAADDETAARRFANAFGEAAEKSQQFADNLAWSSRRGVGDIQTLMSNVQDFSLAQGLAANEAATFSGELTKRAIEISAQTTKSVDEVMGALQQALLGAGRSAKLFGVNIEEAAVKQQAFQMGLDPSALTQQEEIMVRMALVMKQTAGAAGAADSQIGTFNEELRAMATAFGELMGELGKPVIEFLKPIMTVVGDVARSFQEWLANFPLLRGALGFVTAAALGFVGAAALCSTVIAPFLSLVGAGWTILVGYAARLKAVALAQTSVTVTAGGTTLALTRLGVVAAAVGVAFLGWEIGKLLGQLLDLEGAVDRAATGNETLGDSFRNAFVAAAAGPIVGAMYLNDLETIREAEEGMKKSVEEINALADQRIAKMTEEQQAMVKQLELWGFNHTQASIYAGDEMKLLKALEAKVKAGKGNAEIEELIERLRRRNSEALKAQAGAMERNKSAAEKLQEAKERLKKGEEEFLKTVQEIGQDVLRAREGEAAAEIAALQKQLADRLKEVESYAEKELIVMRDLERQKDALAAKGGSRTDKELAEFKLLEQEIAKHASNLNTARQAILNAEEAYNLKLRSIYAKRFEDLRSEQQKELQETRENTRAMVDAYQAGIAEIDAKLNAIRAKRDQGHEAARAFIEQLQRDKLAARDSAQAEIEDLKRTAAANLLAAESEAQRAQIMELAIEKARRVADATREIAEAEKAVSEARARTASARAGEAPEDYARALEEQREKEKEQELAALREKAVERTKALAGFQQHMQDIAEMSRKEAAEADAQEARLKDQRVALEEEIRDVKRQQEETVRGILDKYREMELSLTRQLGLEQQIAQARGGARAGEAPAAATPRAPAVNEAGVAVAQATSAAQESAEAAQAVQAATAQAATAAQTMAATIQTQLEPLRADLASFIKWAGTFAADVSKLMPQVLASIGKVLEEQRAFGASLMQFGNVTLEKLTEAQAAFTLHRTELDSLSAEIGALKLLDAARGEAGLGAQGY